MPQIRMYVEGEIYFVTSRTFNHQKIFASEKTCQLFVEVLDYCRKKYRFRLYAYVVMPDYVHLLILPRGKYNISEIMHRIKGNFAQQYTKRNHKGSVAGWGMWKGISVGEPLWFALNQNRRRIRMNPVWQKSFHDRIIRSDEEMFNTIQYINNNAVKHHLVDDPLKWQYSSYHNYCENGKELIRIDYLE